MKATIEIRVDGPGFTEIETFLGETYGDKQGEALRELAIAMVEAGQRKLDEMEKR